MRDPHVKSLRYLLRPSEGVTFDQPPALEWDTDDFHMILENNVATFEMQRHYPSKEAARQAVERYLRAWHIDMALRLSSPDFNCEFETAEMIDRDPPPPGTSQTIYAEAAMAGASALSAKAHVTKKQYPEPPRTFVLSSDAESMWNRYQRYLDGREPLASMAYFCLRTVEGSTGIRRGARPEASRRYGISERVLSKLGDLTSNVGSERTARKPPPLTGRRDHTQQEIAWIEAAVKASIRRLGEFAYDPARAWPQITMEDLPQLP
jgi:hypothetical protein